MRVPDISTQDPSVTSLPPNYRETTELPRDHRNRASRSDRANLYAFGARTGNDAQLAGWGSADPGRAGDLARHRAGGLAESRFRHAEPEHVCEHRHQMPAAAVVKHALALAVALADNVAVAVCVTVSFG